MPRVVPSQVVAFIDEVFAFARLQRQRNLVQQQYIVDAQYKDRVIALIRLVDELPNELLIMDGAAYNQYVLSVSTIKSTIDFQYWISASPAADIFGRRLGQAISDLRVCLETLPDEQIPAATAGLSFIKDKQLRESIRGDIAFANQAFSGGEWKAATVLAGAAAEALLRWAITNKKSPDIERARIAVNPRRLRTQMIGCWTCTSRSLDTWR
jgi:hypothetical protein